MPRKPKMGRPEIPEAERRTVRFEMRLTREEAAELELKAAKDRVNVTEYVRSRLFEEKDRKSS